ncbi:hypothetical protein QTP70_035008, partial [Hemibagrus guttatus]
DITGPLLDSLQFAYRANRSVDDAVNMGLHYILQHLDKPGTYARILFVDFSSTFNTIIPGAAPNAPIRNHARTSGRTVILARSSEERGAQQGPRDVRRAVQVPSQITEQILELLRNKKEFTFMASIQQKVSTSGVLFSIHESEHRKERREGGLGRVGRRK